MSNSLTLLREAAVAFEYEHIKQQTIQACHKLQPHIKRRPPIKHIKKKHSKYSHIINDKWKNYNNTRLTHKSGVGDICLLDSCTLDSSRYLITNGVNPVNIHVFERDIETFNSMVKLNIGINCYLGNIEDNIDQLINPIRGFYYDGMGNTIDFETIRTVLQKTHKLFEPCSTLAITLCVRNRAGFCLTTLIERITSIVHESFTEPNAKLREVIPYKRYNIEEEKNGALMAFLVFSINNPNDVITVYRPEKVMKTMKGSDILKKKFGTPKNILPNEYYDKVKWYGYALKTSYTTWEPNGSLDAIIDSCNANDTIE
jgi:hypothetical protein